MTNPHPLVIHRTAYANHLCSHGAKIGFIPDSEKEIAHKIWLFEDMKMHLNQKPFDNEEPYAAAQWRSGYFLKECNIPYIGFIPKIAWERRGYILYRLDWVPVDICSDKEETEVSYIEKLIRKQTFYSAEGGYGELVFTIIKNNPITNKFYTNHVLGKLCNLVDNEAVVLTNIPVTEIIVSATDTRRTRTIKGVGHV